MFLLFIAMVIGITVPTGISYVLYKWIKKKGIDKRLRLLAFIPIFIAAYFIYDAVYPSDEFYKVDFKEVTDMEFPKSGNIIAKTASFPDHFGDYISSFLIEFDPNDLKKLENQLINTGFEEKTNRMSSKELDYIEQRVEGKEYAKQFVYQLKNGKHYSVGFLNDNKSVIVTRVSW